MRHKHGRAARVGQDGRQRPLVTLTFISRVKVKFEFYCGGLQFSRKSFLNPNNVGATYLSASYRQGMGFGQDEIQGWILEGSHMGVERCTARLLIDRQDQGFSRKSCNGDRAG